MAKAYGRRPAEWLGPYIAEDDPLLAYQWDRVVFYAGTLWEGEDRETTPGSARKPKTQAEIKRIKARDKMTLDERRAAGHFNALGGLAAPDVKTMEIPKSGVW
jgi:hypothetical protein